MQVKDITCPKCRSKELNEQGTLNIRGFKVYNDNSWWHHCLVCAGYYLGKYIEKDGWFREQ